MEPTLATKLAEVRKLCDYFFNQKSRRAFFLPLWLPVFKIDGEKVNERSFFNRLQQKISDIEERLATDQIAAPSETKNFSIKQSAKLTNDKLTKIYNNYPYFDYLIHGSYADHTSTTASDIDDIIILKKEVFSDFSVWKQTARLLYQLNRYYRTFDPLEHHGHWIMTEFDLKHYDSGLMPLSVFNEASAISRDAQLKINTDQTSSIATTRKVFVRNLQNSRLLAEKLFTDKLNLFYLKDLTSSLVLLLPLAFQISGQDLSKKQAIAEAKDLLDERALKVLAAVSETRHHWSNLPSYWLILFFKSLAQIVTNRGLFVSIISRGLPTIKHRDIIGLREVSPEDLKHFLDTLEKTAHAN